MHIHVHTNRFFIRVDPHKLLYTYIYINVRIQKYVYMNIYIYIYMYIYVPIYVHNIYTHTCTPFSYWGQHPRVEGRYWKSRPLSICTSICIYVMYVHDIYTYTSTPFLYWGRRPRVECRYSGAVAEQRQQHALPMARTMLLVMSL